MTIIEGVLKEEFERIKSHIAAYEQMILKLAKGSISIQKLHGGEYAYRKFKENGKVITEYIGKVNSKEYELAVKERNDYLSIKNDLKQSIIEMNKLRKALRHYGR